MNVQDMYVYTIEDIGLKELRSLYGDHRKLAHWQSCFDKEILRKNVVEPISKKSSNSSSYPYLVLISLAATINKSPQPHSLPPFELDDYPPSPPPVF